MSGRISSEEQVAQNSFVLAYYIPIYALNKNINATLLFFSPHFLYYGLKDLKSIPDTQNYNFFQMLFTNLFKCEHLCFAEIIHPTTQVNQGSGVA